MTTLLLVLVGTLGFLLLIQRLVYRSKITNHKNNLNSTYAGRIEGLIQESSKYKTMVDNLGIQVSELTHAAGGERKRIKKKLNQQRATVKGQLGERLIGPSDDFPYQPSDMFPLAPPFDWLVVDGYSEGAPEFNIVFAEVKTGKATLNKNEQKIKDAILGGRVTYKVFRVEPKITVTEE